MSLRRKALLNNRTLKPGYQIHQRMRFDWLDHVVIETRLVGTAFVLVLAPAGHGDQHDVPAPRLLPDALGRIVGWTSW
jgi:hypothetical protein